jgi:hypothetical protein
MTSKILSSSAQPVTLILQQGGIALNGDERKSLI